jgi:hypothetical protein
MQARQFRRARRSATATHPIDSDYEEAIRINATTGTYQLFPPAGTRVFLTACDMPICGNTAEDEQGRM